MHQYPINLRRYRQNAAVRNLFSTVDLSPRQLIQPYFIYEGLSAPQPLAGIAHQTKHNLDSLMKEIELGMKNSVHNILLFIVPEEKREENFDYSFDAQVISALKKQFKHDLVLFTDLCLCSNTVTGHCGLPGHQHAVGYEGYIDNQRSVMELVKKSLVHAQAGSDVISPSDMMDDRIRGIRHTLNENQLHQTMIMSYSTKFSSQFYGPFREAAQSAPSYGDRKTYQIDPRNLNDALRSSLRDAEQGADILMVKPAGAYLDILYRIKHDSELSHYPLCAYQVSGEYQGLWLMHEAGYVNFQAAYLESLYALRRAGSDLIITYGANQVSSLIKN